MSKKKLITIENFNPGKKKGPVITSPRSLMACERQGIPPEQLLRKSKDEIQLLLIANNRDITEDKIRLYGQHLEERRLAKVKLLIKSRNKIIQDYEKSQSIMQASRMSKSQVSVIDN